MAEPNNTGATRDTLILIGGRHSTSGNRRPHSSDSPRFQDALFSESTGKARRTPRHYRLGRQNARSFVAKPQHSWLVITPKRNKEHRQTYEITVQPDAALPPGRHDTQIRAIGLGRPGAITTIPVVVEVTRPN